ncbi:MAG: hypothetical protein AEth_01178 [Candidatus Argoarchaeum ethanivorans]|uniref:Uncharacterized protein n=1 Tax=Candidatus Argoarchaeum ethanivorans TaxID=2608793 RepID=A0A8B3S1Z8_9EURY|nr:MAG: hypothetical protein AEth_01178 [Candidatus Argoarchaeum ethanivorans]
MRTMFGYTMLGDILLGSFKTKRNFHDPKEHPCA